MVFFSNKSPVLDLINKKKYTEYRINRNTICVDNRRKKNEIISTY